MKKTLGKTVVTIALSAALSASSMIFAQSGQGSGYFLDGHYQNIFANPALAPDRNFIGFPFGSVNIGTKSTLGLSDLFYVGDDGKWHNFTEDGISKADFMSNIEDHNRLNIDTGIPVLYGGFRIGSRVYSSMDLSLRSINNVSLPREVFSFLKEKDLKIGDRYDFDGVKIGTENLVQLSFGMSYAVLENFRVGGRLKLIGGIEAVSLELARFNLTYDGNIATVIGEGTLDAAGSLVRFHTTESASNPGAEIIDFNNVKFDVSGFSFGGFGAGLDLGVFYAPLEWLELSAAVKDIGFISWDKETEAHLNDSFNIDFSSMSDDEKADLKNIIEFEKNPVPENAWKKSLPVSLMAGAKIKLMAYDKLSAGLLYIHRPDRDIPWHEARLSINFEPARWFGISGSYIYGTMGNSYGASLLINATGFALFLAAETAMSGFSPKKTPKGNADIGLSLGIFIPLGKRKG